MHTANLGQEVVNGIFAKTGQAAAKQTETSSQAAKSNSYSKGCIVWYRENNLIVRLLFTKTVSKFFLFGIHYFIDLFQILSPTCKK